MLSHDHVFRLLDLTEHFHEAGLLFFKHGDQILFCFQYNITIIAVAKIEKKMYTLD